MNIHTAVLALAVTAYLVCTGVHAGEAPDGGRMVEVPGAKLHVSMYGSGPPVVFLHGGMSSFDDSFAKQAPYFATFRTVVGIDQRGHGRSPDNDQPFSYRQMAEDTAALIEKLQLGPVDIIGFSDGGNVGLLIARYHPTLVRRLVVSGANARGDINGLFAYVRSLLSQSDKFAAGQPAELHDKYVRISPDGEPHWLTFAAKTKDLWETRVVLDTQDLHAIGIPVLVIAGDHDVITLEHTIEIYRQLPQGQLCIFPATGHATMTERPEEFNRVTAAFLGQPNPK